MNNQAIVFLFSAALIFSSNLTAEAENNKQATSKSNNVQSNLSADQAKASLNKTAAAIVKKLEQRPDYAAFLKAIKQSNVQKMVVWILLDDTGKLKSAMVVPTESAQLDDQITDILQKSSPYEKPAEGIGFPKRFLLRYSRKNDNVQATCEWGYGS